MFKQETFVKDMIKAREKQGTTLRVLEQKSNVKLATLYRIEAGQEPGVNAFLMICKALGLTPGNYFAK